MISVQDYRLHEDDPILGVVVLPLSDLLKERSQITTTLPLVGGIGYGRIKFSLIFRSVQASIPRNLRGWPVGTLVIEPQATSDGLSDDLKRCRLVLKTLYGKGRLVSNSDGTWHQRRDSQVCLPVKNRYGSCLVIQFKRQNLGPDLTPAFCVLWLKDIPDEEDVELDLPVRKNIGKSFPRARSNATDDGAEAVGHLRIKVRFWSGLSGFHKHLASKDEALAEVMHALDCTEEHSGSGNDEFNDENATSSSSDSSSDEEAEDKSKMVRQVKEYGKKQKALGSKHRGLMQWSGVRKAAWLQHKVVDGTKHKFSNTWSHHQVNDGALDKEV